MSHDGIVLITSAAYVEAELAAEFGEQPPAFLPVGHARLYEWQLRSIMHLPGRRILTIPESFAVPPWDRRRLSDLGVSVLPLPDKLSLNDSVLAALTAIGPTRGVVRLLHGDTLIYDLPGDDSDLAAIGKTSSAYAWGTIDRITGCFQAARVGPQRETEVLAGYFSFTDGEQLRGALSTSGGSFLKALETYRRRVELQTMLIGSWLDFGHLQTYYKSRCNIRTQRHFNDMEIASGIVQKVSADEAKLTAEARWFEDLPPPLRAYTASYLGRRQVGRKAGYALEYLPVPSLHELFVFGRLGLSTWSAIVESCFDFLHSCNQVKPDIAADVTRALTIDKTMDRLARFARSNPLSIEREWHFRGASAPSLTRIAEITSAAISPTDTETIGVMHGDFCFTNIFFDARTQRIRAIDPRGSILAGQPTTFGDARYDLAKFAHSVLGNYDFILSGRFLCTGLSSGDLDLTFPEEASMGFLPAIAAEHKVAGRGIGDLDVIAMTIHLFLSMLPLHEDRPERQEAFLVNTIRLFMQHWDRVAA